MAGRAERLRPSPRVDMPEPSADTPEARSSGRYDLAVICGYGSLPVEIARAALENGRSPYLIGIKGEAEAGIEAFPNQTLAWGQIGRLFQLLKGFGIGEAIFAGGVGRRPEFLKMKLDWGAVRALPQMLVFMMGGDNTVLSGTIRIFEGHGVRIASIREIAPQFMARYDAYKQDRPDVVADPVPEHTPGADEICYRKSDHRNCSEILWQNLARNPDKVAVDGPAGTLTYSELVAEAARWGNAFVTAGLERGERIAFFLDDTPTFPAAFYGAVRAGFVPVLLNVQTKPDVLNYFLKDTSARFAVVDAELADIFSRDTVEGTGLETTIIANGAAEGKGFLSADAFLDGQPSEMACADTGPDDMAFWMYSSGSTGRPKGIVHLHHDMAYVQQSYGDHVLKLKDDDISYSVPKAYFAYGFGNSLIFPFYCGATTLLIPGQPRPDVVLDAIETYKPTVLFGLPTLYTALARSEGIEKRDLSSLRQSMSAAEILSEDVYKAWKQKVGHGPTEGLGSTEVLHIYLSNLLDDHRIGAAGARVPGYEVRLETPEGEPAKPGEEGVMLVRGHSTAPIYWNRPDKTRETMRGEWLYTGDRFLEREGYYYFQGRADDLIKVSGQWVWPLEVERCLNEHPDVHECAVLAHQLEDKRMALRAVVSLVSGVAADDAKTRELRDYVKSQLTPFKSPRIFEYLPELPKTGTGKIDRQAIINMPVAETA